MDKLDELIKKSERLKRNSSTIIGEMDSIIQESYRVSSVAANSETIFENLELEFERITGLDSIDVKFLFFATALQCARQYFMSNEKFRFEKASDGDKFMKGLVPKSYHQILIQSVPYDAFKKYEGYQDVKFGVSGRDHRYTTLGHDPILGWIFGTLNILTDSLTKNNLALESYRVINSSYLTESVSVVQLFNEGIGYVCNDYKLLIAAILRQAVHIGADSFTKMGLPIPIINSVSPELSSKLLSEQFRVDVYSVSRGIMLSTLINSIIGAIHGLFYNCDKHINRDLYEVKTRKILSMSNLMATSSNAIYCGITRDFTKLDIGGMIVTIYRLINDYKFINEVKEEFVFGEFDKLIRGI